MSRYPFNANRTPGRLFLTRVGIVPHYAKVEMEKSLRLKENKTPEKNSQNDIIALMPQHSMGKVEAKGRQVATIGRLKTNEPFFRLITTNDEAEIRERVNEMYAQHMEKLKKKKTNVKMTPLPPNIGADTQLVQVHHTVVPNKSNELISGSCTVKILTQIAIFLYENCRGDYEKLNEMFKAQPPLTPTEIFDQLNMIGTKLAAMQAAKRALQEEHRLLTNQLQLYDLERMDNTNPPAESKEIQEARTTWSYVFHMLDLYGKGDLQ